MSSNDHECDTLQEQVRHRSYTETFSLVYFGSFHAFEVNICRLQFLDPYNPYNPRQIIIQI